MNNNRTCGNQMQQGAQRCHCPAENTLSALPENPVVAMAYVPFQTDNSVYSAEQALTCGTIFPVLNKPFTGVCGRCRT